MLTLGKIGREGVYVGEGPPVEGVCSTGDAGILGEGKPVERATGYGRLVAMDDGNLTPGIFDGMGAFPGSDGNTVLIRNHENRRQLGEFPVEVPAQYRYDQDPLYNAGNTKLVVDANLEVVESFAILGGTDTNCAGGQTPYGTWISCEEAVNRGVTGTATYSRSTPPPTDPRRPDRSPPPGASGKMLENPDNVVIVPKTGDIFLQEDSGGEQFVRGLTPDGKFYDFAKTITNDTEFCGGCFSPDGTVFFLNQQGERGGPAEGPPGQNAVTYAITDPFEQRR